MPVLLARADASEHRNVILMAAKLQDKAYAELNAKVIERGQWAAKRYDAQLHLVNACEDSLDRPDRAKVLEQAGVPNEQVHFVYADPDKAIAEVAEKIDADMLILGTQRRTGLKATFRGNTVEKIVKRVDQDIMMLL